MQSLGGCLPVAQSGRDIAFGVTADIKQTRGHLLLAEADNRRPPRYSNRDGLGSCYRITNGRFYDRSATNSDGNGDDTRNGNGDDTRSSKPSNESRSR